MTKYGETWVYESIVGAVPGVDVPEPVAVALQFALFEGAVLALAWYYGLWGGVLAGTAAVGVATAGSAIMLVIGRDARAAAVPATYRRLLFSSSIEVVLSVLAFVALVSYLLTRGQPLVRDLLGADPPVVVVYVTLLVLWDVCYRIGTGWWASVVALWRSARYRFGQQEVRRLRHLDLATMGFGLLQLVLVPFVVGYPVLLVAVVGHVVAVTLVTGLSIALLERRKRGPIARP